MIGLAGISHRNWGLLEGGERPGVMHEDANTHWGATELASTLFSFDPESRPGGVDALDPVLTIAGVSVEPTFRYFGGDATSSSWPARGYGEDLPSAGSGGTYNAGSPLTGSSNDDSVNADGTQLYASAGTTFGDISTEDFVFELVFQAGDFAARKGILSKRQTGAPFGGYLISVAASSGVMGITVTGSDNSSVTNAAALSAGAWYHAIIFADRSGSAQWYVNGAASGLAGAIYLAGDMTADGTMRLLAQRAGIEEPDFPVAYLAMWQRDAWLDTHLQATIAAERFARLNGTWHNNQVPTFTRATSATLVSGGNHLTYSEDLSNAGWVKTRATASSTSVSTPFGTSTTATIAEDASGATSHFIHQSVTMGSGAVTFSAYLKAANRNWVRMDNNTPSDAQVHFNLSDGSTGRVGADVTSSSITPVGDDWYRCSMTHAAGGGAENYRIIIAEADNDVVFTGLSQDSIYATGLMVNEGTTATTYRKTHAYGGYKLYQVGSGWPRIDDGPLGKGFRSELAATNIALQSQSFDVTWSEVNAASTFASPDPAGGNEAARLLDDSSTGSGTVAFDQSFTSVVDTVYTFSAFLKADQLTWANLQIRQLGALDINTSFDLSAGAVGTDSADVDSSSIESYGNGWYRCSITYTSDAADTTGSMRIKLADGTADASVDLDGTSSVFVYGAQLEAGPLATAYIPTTTSVTRNADFLTYGFTGTNPEGTLSTAATVADYDIPATGYVAAVYVDADNYISMAYTSADKINSVGRSGGTTYWSLSPPGDISDGARHSAIVSYGLNDISTYLDGTEVGSGDQSATVPVTMTTVSPGAYQGGVSQLNGIVHNVKIFNRKRRL